MVEWKDVECYTGNQYKKFYRAPSNNCFSLVVSNLNLDLLQAHVHLKCKTMDILSGYKTSLFQVSLVSVKFTKGRGVLSLVLIDGFQMLIKHPIPEGKRDQEAAVQRIFYLVRSSFFYLSALMVRTQCSTY